MLGEKGFFSRTVDMVVGLGRDAFNYTRIYWGNDRMAQVLRLSWWTHMTPLNAISGWFDAGNHYIGLSASPPPITT